MSFESNNFEPNIILCVFPNLEKILFLSSGSNDKNLFTIQSKLIFNEEFFDSIESKFSKTLRSGNLSLLGPNGVPEKIENILRDETIETIIDSVNQKLELNSDVNQENISIFQVTHTYTHTHTHTHTHTGFPKTPISMEYKGIEMVMVYL